MTTSTPPAWAWLDAPIAYPANALSIHSRKVPDSDALSIQNDSPDPTYQGCLPSERYPSDEPERAVSTTASGTYCVDQCSECRCPPGQPHAPGCDISCSPDVSCDRKDDATGCDEAAKVTDSVSNAVETHVAAANLHDGEPIFKVTAPGEPIFKVTAPETSSSADSFVVASCPECDSMMDIDYGTVKDKPPDCQGCEPEPARSAIGAGPLFDDGVHSAHETPTNLPVGARSEYPEPELLTSTVNPSGDVVTVLDDNLSVPFPVQQWMFESLCEEMVAQLPHLIFTHSERIIEMARRRFRAGYAKYGSTMYSWSPERRLDETLQELADATVYQTSGSVE